MKLLIAVLAIAPSLSFAQGNYPGDGATVVCNHVFHSAAPATNFCNAYQLGVSQVVDKNGKLRGFVCDCSGLPSGSGIPVHGE